MILDINIDSCVPFFHVAPKLYEGDRIGHIGAADAFFWVLEGEIFLMIDDKSFIVHPGQLAFLPRGKMRTYTPSNSNFSMYEMTFTITIQGQNIMEYLGVDEDTLIVDIPDPERVTKYFERSFRHGVGSVKYIHVEVASTILNIIYSFINNYKTLSTNDKILFEPVLSYMKENLDKSLTVSDLCKIMHMQSSYFVTRFKNAFGYPPITYLNNLRLYHAMTLLLTKPISVEQISSAVGFEDTSYFTRKFKKFTGLTPTDYRKNFHTRRRRND